MYRLILVFLAILLLLPGVASAQGDGEPLCADADIDAAIDTVLAQLQEAKAQEPSTALETIDEVRQVLAVLNSQCLGLTLTGTAGTVHGPVDIPEGIYRASVTTEDFFIMNGTVLEGECGDGYGGELFVFNEGLGGGKFTAETVFKSEGCSVLFETSNIFGPYTVTFEKLK